MVGCCSLERAPAAVDAALQCIIQMAAAPALQVALCPFATPFHLCLCKAHHLMYPALPLSQPNSLLALFEAALLSAACLDVKAVFTRLLLHPESVLLMHDLFLRCLSCCVQHQPPISTSNNARQGMSVAWTYGSQYTNHSASMRAITCCHNLHITEDMYPT